MANDKAFKVKNTLELAGYNTSIASTAVDVFIYDTSKDSDGGAWRKRTQHTSWYNETLNTATRGSRREFPAVAVIVAEATKVTIYDGDDPAMPMWRVDARGSTVGWSGDWDGKCVTAKNGAIVRGTTHPSYLGYGAVTLLSLVGDYAIRYSQNLDVKSAIFNSTFSTGAGTNISAAIVNSFVNDVAMTVLPDAPIDPATGLPVPTIAVATDGGISQIGWDGVGTDNVWDITSSTYPVVNKVDFLDDNRMIALFASTLLSINNIVTADDAGVGQLGSGIRYTGNVGDEPTLPLSGGTRLSGGVSALSGGGGLYLLKDDPVTKAKGMVAYVTSSYNSGYQNGDIKGAFLSSTDTASLVGEDVAVNGTFDTDATGWNLGTDWQYDAVNQRLARVGSTYHNAFPTATIANLVIGQSYTMEVECGAGSGTVGYYTSSGVYGALATGINRISFTYKGGNYPFFYSSSSDRWIDNFKVFRSSHDRSVNADGKRASDLIVNGTVTRSPVATGAELVAYSGFSASNYLEQPYNSALDFGTGDFCVMGWFKTTSTSKRIINRQSADNYWNLYVNPTGKISLDFSLGSHLDGTISVNGNTWTHVAAFRKSGVCYLFINGSLDASVLNTTDLDDADALLTVGRDFTGVQPFDAGSLALWRISATAPTAEQIKKIYEDEKVLFQDNAAATLYGTSDAVTALAHDEDTGLLHVGTSAGRSVFQGLRRVSNTTTAVGTAISASGGMVVEE